MDDLIKKVRESFTKILDYRMQEKSNLQYNIHVSLKSESEKDNLFIPR